MSMIGYLLRVSPQQVQTLLGNPELFQSVLGNSVRPGSDDVGEALDKLAPALDLQQAWHLLHYFLCGEPYQGVAPADTLLAGDDIGPDLGNGPARYMTPAETADFSQYLSELQFEVLAERMQMDRACNLHVYPINDANKEPKAGWVDYLEPHFLALREYMAEAEAAGEGYLFWIW